MIKKIKTIILSRFKKQQREEEWVTKRRVTCLECEYNSINVSNTSVVQDFLTALSSFYSWVTGRSKEEGSIGYCTICGCDCFFKSLEESEVCEKDKWKEIDKLYRLNIYKERKNGSNKNNRKI